MMNVQPMARFTPPPACFGMSVKGRKESLDYRLKAYNPDGGSRKGIPAVEFVAEQIADGDKNFNIIGLATGADAVTWKDGTEDERERLKDRAFNSYQQGSTRK